MSLILLSSGSMALVYSVGPGAVLASDVPGGIGVWGALRDPTAVQTDDDQITTLLRFDEDDGVPSVDICGGLNDMLPPTGLTPPTGAQQTPLGRGVLFANGKGLAAQDRLLAGTLLQRNMTVIAILHWDIAAQSAAGTPGTIIAAGMGTALAEYMPFAVQLAVIDAPNRIGAVQMLWHDSAGNLKTQTGPNIKLPDATSFVMLTITRRWISASSVAIRYFFGDQLALDVASTDGDIGGGTTHTTSIGTRYTGGAYTNFLYGTLDELALANYEMSPEEIANMWQRIAVLQPDGYRLIRDHMPPGMPISDEPTSRPQTELRAIGAALGFAEAKAENLHRNVFPTRAYGEILELWEDAARQPPKQGDSIDTRRTRVVGHLQKRQGCIVEGVQQAVSVPFAIAPSQVETIAFSNTITDDFTSIREERWKVSAGWDVIGGELRVQGANGASYLWDANGRSGRHALISLSPFTKGSDEVSDGVSIFGSVDPQTLPAGAEAGLLLFDWGVNAFFFFGVRNTGGVYQVGYQRVRALGAADAAFVVLATTALEKHWLRMVQPASDATFTRIDSFFTLSWSVLGSAESQFSSTATGAIAFNRVFRWAGMYFRSTGALGSAADVRFGSDFSLRQKNGVRPFRWYVYRDPGLPGSADIPGARSIAQRMRYANTYCDAITTKSALCDNVATVCDRGPCGAL